MSHPSTAISRVALALVVLVPALTGPHVQFASIAGQKSAAVNGEPRQPVRIQVSARDKSGRVVTDLSKEDIRVFENDLPQTVVDFEQKADSPASIVLLINCGPSQARRLAGLKLAAREVIASQMRPKLDQAGVISFTGQAVLQQGSTNDPAKLGQGIERIKYEAAPSDLAVAVYLGKISKEQGQLLASGTAIWDSIWLACDLLLTATSSRRTIIMVTDGEDTASRLQMSETIQRAIRADVAIYTVGMGDGDANGVNRKVLRNVAAETGGREFFPGKEKDLRVVLTEIMNDLRSEYLISYSAPAAGDYDEFRKVRVEVINPQLRKRGLQVFHRQGYYAR